MRNTDRTKRRKAHELYLSGKEPGEISLMLGISARTVTNWIYYYDWSSERVSILAKAHKRYLMDPKGWPFQII